MNPFLALQVTAVAEALRVFETGGMLRWKLEAALLTDGDAGAIPQFVPLAYGERTIRSYKRVFFDPAADAGSTATMEPDDADGQQNREAVCEGELLKDIARRWGLPGLQQYLDSAAGRSDISDDLLRWLRSRLARGLLSRAVRSVTAADALEPRTFAVLASFAAAGGADDGGAAEREFKKKNAELDAYAEAVLKAIEDESSRIETHLGQGPITPREPFLEDMPADQKEALAKRMRFANAEELTPWVKTEQPS